MISPTPDITPDPHEAAIDGFPVASASLKRDGVLTLEDLADRFAAETRAGLGPTIEGYAAKYPEMAEDIHEVFPAVLALEQWKLNKEAECLRRNVPRKFPLEQLGEYRLTKEIGRGGMGVVFEATQGPSKRRVAVKVLPWKYGSSVPRWKKRFETEVRTISQLKHPNIIEVFGFGDQEGYCYFAMQLVEGVSLDRIIKRFLDDEEVCLHEELELSRAEDGATNGQMPRDPDAPPPQRLRRDRWTEFARIISQAARGVEYAHRQGVLHNDVKPGNVLVDSLGRVRVGDFGLARDLDGDIEATEDFAGTLRYMAPERFSGKSDPRSDVYSLGVTLYELVTQHQLVADDDRIKMIESIEHAGWHPPRRVNPEVPIALETIVLKALESDPVDRYQSALELSADLLRFANGQPVTVKRPGPIRKLWRSVRRML